MKYHLLLRITHWLTSITIIGLIIAGYIMTELGKDDTILGLGKWDIYGLHKSFGVTVIILFLIRIVLRLGTKIPEIPYEIKPLEAIFAKIGHFFLYVFIFAVPLSGFIMSQAGGYGVKLFGYKLPTIIEKNKELGGLAHEIHGYIPYVLAGLVVIHIAAVIKHAVVDKVNLIKRMV